MDGFRDSNPFVLVLFMSYIRSVNDCCTIQLFLVTISIFALFIISNKKGKKRRVELGTGGQGRSWDLLLLLCVLLFGRYVLLLSWLV